MGFIGNILWLILGGIIAFLFWIIIGILYCLTIIGIPFGMQAFKIAKLTLAPFGKDIQYNSNSTGRFLGNLFWVLFGGIELALTHILFGIILFVTIIGIPFAKQHFKLALLSFMPFGANIK